MEVSGWSSLERFQGDLPPESRDAKAQVDLLGK